MMTRMASNAPCGAGTAAPSALASRRKTMVAPPTAIKTSRVAKIATRARNRPRIRRQGGPCQLVGGQASPAGHHGGRSPEEAHGGPAHGGPARR